jgi:hypothetical protein
MYVAGVQGIFASVLEKRRKRKKKGEICLSMSNVEAIFFFSAHEEKKNIEFLCCLQ